MASAGPFFGTGSNLDRGGSEWEYPTSINAIDDDEASTNVDYYSDYLVCKNLGFAIPSSAIITDVSFTYRRWAWLKGIIQDDSIVLCDGGNNVANTSYWDNETITKHGGNAYWGVTLTPTMVNSANFGLKISAKSNAGYNIGTIDYVTCTITYTIDSYSSSRTAFMRF